MSLYRPKARFRHISSESEIEELKQLGLSDGAVRLMESYPKNRKTAVTIGINTSQFRSVNVGVPQGSKLGSIFITYINDMLRLSCSVWKAHIVC